LGIAETLITMLAQVPKLMVIGKVSSFSYKGQAVDPRTIGQQLGVGALLEGSVQRAGDRLRVAVQLVSTGDGGHLCRRRPMTAPRRTYSRCRMRSRSG
jgi:adenylate cyclase